MKESYVFILSVIDFEGKTPIEIIPNHFLKKANADQINKIKELIQLFNPNFINIYPHEYSISTTTNNKTNQTSYNRTPLSVDEWKYWIIAFNGSNDKIKDLQISLSLQKYEIELGFTIIGDNGLEAYIYESESLVSFFLDPEINLRTTTRINTDDVIKIGETYQLINKLNTDNNYIKSSLMRFGTINHIPRQSELYIIGLFSIIESLITHRPQLIELSDSLTHQISNKMNLLLKRSVRKMDYNNFF